MDKSMIAKCGAYCGDCNWRVSTGCPGCKECASQMFWGECDKAKCCIEHGFDHCGNCPEMPCQKLLELFADTEHGDNGARLNNLKNWANDKYVFEKLGK